MLSSLERKLMREDWRITGLDEAGRGPLAGPVLAAAVAITDLDSFKKNYSSFKNLVRDSKSLSAKKREFVYKLFKSYTFIEWGTGRVSQNVIDRINILAATQLAMEKAVANLNKKINPKTNFLMIDGNLKLNLAINQKAIIQGDKKIFLISAASIIAKVTRDRIMVRYARKYPDYQFEKHKGYGTKRHMELIKEYYPCPLHRRSFEPIKTIVKNNFL
jgi:ribonuclease HII